MKCSAPSTTALSWQPGSTTPNVSTINPSVVSSRCRAYRTDRNQPNTRSCVYNHSRMLTSSCCEGGCHVRHDVYVLITCQVERAFQLHQKASKCLLGESHGTVTECNLNTRAVTGSARFYLHTRQNFRDVGHYAGPKKARCCSGTSAVKNTCTITERTAGHYKPTHRIIDQERQIQNGLIFIMHTHVSSSQF